MFRRIRNSWCRFKQSKSGQRFQDLYHRRQRQSKGRFNATKLFNVVGGIAIALAGLFLVPAPGPGWVIVFFGLGLLGCEFLPIARFLDGAELKVRDWLAKAKAIWAQLPIVSKVLISLLVAIVIVALGYGTYYLFFSNSGK